MSDEGARLTAEIERLWRANPDARIHISGGKTVNDMDVNTKRIFLADLRIVVGLDDKADGPAGGGV